MPLPIELLANDQVDYIGQLRQSIRPGFLDEMRWDSDLQYVSPPRDHPLLGQPKCESSNCNASISSPGRRLCQVCGKNWKKSGLAHEQFIQSPTAKRTKIWSSCAVDGCRKGSSTFDGLCYNHSNGFRSSPYSDMKDWIKNKEPAPITEVSPCSVKSCIRSSDLADLCETHHKQWKKKVTTGTYEDTLEDKQDFRETADPAGNDYVLILRGLPEKFILESLLALQCRYDNETKLDFTPFRYLLKLGRTGRYEGLTDINPDDIVRKRTDVKSLLYSALRDIPRAIGDPTTEFKKMTWDMAIFGCAGKLNFQTIEQDWLITLVKNWIIEDLPKRRSTQPSATARIMVSSATLLSESLIQYRPDRGSSPPDLGREDMLNHLIRLRYLVGEEEISVAKWIRVIRHTRRLFDDARALGLLDSDGLVPNLSPRFQILKTDVPKEDRKRGPGRDFPTSVVRSVLKNISILEQASGEDSRRLLEILIDTGRRPQEICNLSFECLELNDNGDYTIIYDDAKNYRVDSRLAIVRDTANTILAQQSYVRQKFPDTSEHLLPLFPCDYRNPSGTRSTRLHSFSSAWSRFIAKIADELRYEDGTPFPLSRMQLYGWRHTYAQRHADAGTQPHVLQELMGHRSHETTQGYYRITETRSRSAIEVMASMQFNGQGGQIANGLDELMDHEHARIRIGQLAVPFGNCTEPSNVKAEGEACPYKFTCLGCSHFKSDPSYLPELKSYLDHLLKSREMLLSTRDVQEWARDKAMPADQEVSQVRNLIARLENKLESLSAQDRTTIQNAIDVVRSTRKTVNIGLPYIRSGEQQWPKTT